MRELDRLAFILKPTEVMFEWVKGLSQDDSEITFDDLLEDSTVLLFPVFEDDDEIWDYFEENYLAILENELSSWTLDEDQWPADRSLELFHEWFYIEQHNMVIDLASHDIFSNDVVVSH